MGNESKNVSFSRPYREEDPMATEQNATNIPLDALSHRFVDTNGLRIHIAEQGTGPLMLLCHGFPELWYSWRRQFSTLAKAGIPLCPIHRLAHSTRLAIPRPCHPGSPRRISMCTPPSLSAPDFAVALTGTAISTATGNSWLPIVEPAFSSPPSSYGVTRIPPLKWWVRADGSNGCSNSSLISAKPSFRAVGTGYNWSAFKRSMQRYSHSSSVCRRGSAT